MAVHEQSVGATDEWYTPAYVFDALGCTFDLDVASPNPPVAWVPAKDFLFDGLAAKWRGFVWMNPPFGGRNGIEPWLRRFLAHRNGIALTPDRTSAPWWQRTVCLMDACLFVSPKIKFIGPDGNPGRSPAQGTCLFALGRRGCLALENARAAGLGVLMRDAGLFAEVTSEEIKQQPKGDGNG